MSLKQETLKVLKHCYALFLQRLEETAGIGNAKRIDAFVRFGKVINLKNPRTLSDKVCYLGLFALEDLAVTCTDKWEVRNYVAQKGLSDILIPVCQSAVSSVQEINWNSLPERFVLKATHGCGMNDICLDKAKLDRRRCQETMQSWLDTTYGTFSIEPHYRRLTHRIYAERYIGGEEGIVDYKIHCLNGKPCFILVCRGRVGSAVTMDIFDLNWKWLDAVQPYKKHIPGDGQVARPKNLDRMISIAEKLSEDFAFVRVDLYDVNGQVYFGELTFTPANGVFPSYKPEFLKWAGEQLKITEG